MKRRSNSNAVYYIHQCRQEIHCTGNNAHNCIMLSKTASTGTPIKKTLLTLQQSISNVFFKVKQPAQATAIIGIPLTLHAKHGSFNLNIIPVMGSHIRRCGGCNVFPACIYQPQLRRANSPNSPATLSYPAIEKLLP